MSRYEYVRVRHLYTVIVSCFSCLLINLLSSKVLSQLYWYIIDQWVIRGKLTYIIDQWMRGKFTYIIDQWVIRGKLTYIIDQWMKGKLTYIVDQWMRGKLTYIPFEMVRAGDHWERSISRHILPLLLMLGWYILVVNVTCK